MKMENKFLGLRSFTAFCLMFAVFAATSLVASAAPETNVSMGELIVSGSNVEGGQSGVLLNGEEAFSGRTFFSSGTIATPEGTTATVKLGKSGSVSLAPNSVLSLSFDDSRINGTLTAGQINVSGSEGVLVNIVNGDGSAIIGQGGLYSTNTNALPARQDDDDGSVSDASQFALIAVFAGVVAVAAIYVLTKDDDDDLTVSPVR